MAAMCLAAACSSNTDSTGTTTDPSTATASGSNESRFYVVVFEDYPDLTRVAAIEDFRERGRSLVRTLQENAEASQAEARQLLEDAGVEYRQLWLANAIALCTCDQAMAERLAELDGVEAVVGGRDAQIESADDEPAVPGPPPTNSPPLDSLGVTSLRARPDAPTGAGVTVGVIDTGVDGAHPALAAGYRGAPDEPGAAPQDDRNWFDPYGECSTPCDPQGHGTHVASVAVGRPVTPAAGSATSVPGWSNTAEAAVPAVGVAPGANWIAARGCTGTVCDLDELLAALQFMVAPTDRNGERPDPDVRPDVVVNSWGLTRPNPALERAQRAVEASGIIPVAAAGNLGPECGSVTTPGSHRSTLTVGALGADRRPLPTSGRGPGPTDSQPNVAVIGEQVPGALPRNGWGTMTGTSQAAPQVAGLVALLLDRDPELRGDFLGVERRIDGSATAIPDDSCGVDPEDPEYNNVTGTGLPNAERLFDQR